MIISQKRLAIMVAAVFFLLLVPFTAMQFSSEVDWSASDFLLMGSLLLTTVFGVEIVLRNVKDPVHRFLLCAALLVVLFLVWAELAVGIFNSPIAGS